MDRLRLKKERYLPLVKGLVDDQLTFPKLAESGPLVVNSRELCKF